MEPLEALKIPVEQVIKLLKDSNYQDVSKKDLQREKIWETIKSIFNFREMAKRVLARNWKKFSPQQRKEFAALFTELLGNAYIGKMQAKYEDEEVVYQGQKMISATKARVKTKIIRGSMDIPVVYSMLNRNGSWKIYDVNIEGVSLVKNYRVQFNKILIKNSPARLIERLKKKIELHKKNRAKKG